MKKKVFFVLLIILLAVAGAFMLQRDDKEGDKKAVEKEAPSQNKSDDDYIILDPKEETQENPNRVDLDEPINSKFLAVPKSVKILYLQTKTMGYKDPEAKGGEVINKLWRGSGLYLPVTSERPGWYKVRLPQRPNGKTAWIQSKTEGMKIYTTKDYIRLDRSTRTLRWYQGGKVKLQASASMGTRQTPTPSGRFYMTFQASPPRGIGGEFMLVTSAHSNAIENFGGINDAISAIHGPLGGDEASIREGTNLSHGCVRISLSDLNRLSKIAPGTPIDILP